MAGRTQSLDIEMFLCGRHIEFRIVMEAITEKAGYVNFIQLRRNLWSGYLIDLPTENTMHIG